MTTAPGGSRHHERKTGPMNEYATSENSEELELRPFDPREADSFDAEQRVIHDWATSSSGYVGEVIAQTSVLGMRAGIDKARRVALEHENRAAAARQIEQRLRDELVAAAQHGHLGEDEPDGVEMTLAEANKHARARGLDGPLFTEKR